jgi:hypothetical protein
VSDLPPGIPNVTIRNLVQHDALLLGTQFRPALAAAFELVNRELCQQHYSVSRR